MPWVTVDRRAAGAGAPRGRVLRPPEPTRCAVVGITGTNGKTTTAYLLAAIFEAAGVRCGMLGTVAYRIGRASDTREASRDDAGGAGRAGAAARDGRRAAAAPARWRCRRTRWRFARGRHDVRGRRLHEPDARSPRFPRRHGGLLPGQAPAVRDAAARRAEPHQRRRSRGAPALADAGGTAGDVRDQSRRPTSRPGRCRSRSRACASTSGRRAARCTSARRWSAGRTSTTSSRRSRPRRRWTCRSTRSSAASGSSPACPAGSRSSSGATDEVTVVVDYAHTDDALETCSRRRARWRTAG